MKLLDKVSVLYTFVQLETIFFTCFLALKKQKQKQQHKQYIVFNQIKLNFHSKN